MLLLNGVDLADSIRVGCLLGNLSGGTWLLNTILLAGVFQRHKAIDGDRGALAHTMGHKRRLAGIAGY